MRTLAFLLLSSLKWGKLATTGGTMLLSLGVYAMIWGWRYAAGFIVLLLVHEMGHVIQMKRETPNTTKGTVNTKGRAPKNEWAWADLV